MATQAGFRIAPPAIVGALVDLAVEHRVGLVLTALVGGGLFLRRSAGRHKPEGASCCDRENDGCQNADAAATPHNHTLLRESYRKTNAPVRTAHLARPKKGRHPNF